MYIFVHFLIVFACLGGGGCNQMKINYRSCNISLYFVDVQFLNFI